MYQYKETRMSQKHLMSLISKNVFLNVQHLFQLILDDVQQTGNTSVLVVVSQTDCCHSVSCCLCLTVDSCCCCCYGE